VAPHGQVAFAFNSFELRQLLNASADNLMVQSYIYSKAMTVFPIMRAVFSQSFAISERIAASKSGSVTPAGSETSRHCNVLLM